MLGAMVRSGTGCSEDVVPGVTQGLVLQRRVGGGPDRPGIASQEGEAG